MEWISVGNVCSAQFCIRLIVKYRHSGKWKNAKGCCGNVVAVVMGDDEMKAFEVVVAAAAPPIATITTTTTTAIVKVFMHAINFVNVI